MWIFPVDGAASVDNHPAAGGRAKFLSVPVSRLDVGGRRPPLILPVDNSLLRSGTVGARRYVSRRLMTSFDLRVCWSSWSGAWPGSWWGCQGVFPVASLFGSPWVDQGSARSRFSTVRSRFPRASSRLRGSWSGQRRAGGPRGLAVGLRHSRSADSVAPPCAHTPAEKRRPHAPEPRSRVREPRSHVREPRSRVREPRSRVREPRTRRLRTAWTTPPRLLPGIYAGQGHALKSDLAYAGFRGPEAAIDPLRATSRCVPGCRCS